MGGNPIRRAAQPSGFSFLRQSSRGRACIAPAIGEWLRHWPYLRVSRLTARSGGEGRWISGFDALRIRQGAKPEGASYAG
jgi:hypothetical protein